MDRQKLLKLNLLLSPLGLLPILAAYLIVGKNFFEALGEPGPFYDRIAGNVFSAFWGVLGNIGDLLGYYVIMLPNIRYLVDQFRQNSAQSPFAKAAKFAGIAYGINGGLWALFSAVAFGFFALQTYSETNRQGFIVATTLAQKTGWGVIGNSLGSLAWILFGILLLKESGTKKKVFGVFTLVLGISYFLGGEIAGRFVPEIVNFVGIGFYLLFALVWNVLLPLLVKEEK